MKAIREVESAPAPLGPPRSSRLSLYLIVVSLLALGLLPLVGDRYVSQYRDDVRELVEPARNYLTEIHVSLALGSAALRDYLDTQDTVFLNLYEAAVSRERAAYTEVAPVVAHLGNGVRTRYRELRAAETSWHIRVGQLLRESTENLGDVRVALANEQAYEKTLLAAASLDQALAEVASMRRQRIDRAEQMIRWLSLGLASLAAGAGLIALSLGRRMRNFALAAEQARQELEQVVASRERLSRSITHDLKNPLNAIMGNLQLLELQGDGELAPAHKERIHKAEKSANSMLHMIDSLLELERARSGTLQIKRTQLDLRALVIEIGDDHRAAIENAGLEFHVETDKSLVPVETDPALVARVLGNLLGNATKFTPKGSVSLRAQPVRDGGPGAGPWIAISVHDTGRGIPKEHLGHIFEEFNRVESSTVPGTGIGLAVSRRLARLLGGDITVSSEVGVGSTFTFWLPQQRVLDATSATSATEAR